MLRLVSSLFALVLSVSLALAGSTIDPTQPAVNSNLTSGPVRGNFSAAYSDINNILGAYPATTAPANPTVGQFWRKTNLSPQIIYQWSGSAWLPYSTFDIGGGRVTPAFGNSFLAWQQLLTGTGGLGVAGQCLTSTGASTVPTAQDCITSSSVNAALPLSWNAATKTMSLNYGADLTLSGSNLVLSSIIAGQTQGNGTQTPVITVDTKGRVTALTFTQTTPPFTALTGQASLSQLPNIGNNTVLGNVSGASTFPSALSTAQITTLVNLATGTLSGAVPAWPNDGTKFFDGTGNYNPVPFASITGSLACGQMPALTGDISSTAGTCATAIGAGKVTNTMLAGSIAASKLIGTDIATVGTVTTGSWTASVIGVPFGGTGSATAAGARTNLGLAIGTNVEAWSAVLDGFALKTVPTGAVVGTSDTQTLTGKNFDCASNVCNVRLGSDVTGTLLAASFPALTGDVTTTAGSLATTLATVNANVGAFGTSALIPNFTVDAKGRVTAAGSTSIQVGSATVKGVLQTDGSTITNAAGTISATTATTTQLGVVKPDGTTINISGGVISSVGSVASSVQPGTTTVTGGTLNNCLGTGTSSTMNQIPCASLTAAGQVLSGGATVTSAGLTTGTNTIDCGARPLQFITGSTSAWGFNAPVADGSCMILLTNPASSVNIPSFSGFTVGSGAGSALTATASAKFTISVWRINGVSGYQVTAMQ